MGLLKEFTKGFTTELAPFRLVLGLCPTLACSTSVKNGVGMGLALTFVLAGSNIFISLLRKVIPDKVRIAAFIVIVASFVVVVELTMKAWFLELDKALGIFIPLIVVNCIPLGRAEAYSSKRGVADSAMDGLGIGLGYTLSLGGMGVFREVLGKGSFFDIQVMGDWFQPMGFLQAAPGAFVCLGLALGMMNLITSLKKA
jgi:electron transport complex protein RnfE